MFTNIYIYNNVPFHYEIIESVILKYELILNCKIENPKIYVTFVDNPNINFGKYIKKYTNISFNKPNIIDYSINCTIYEADVCNIDKNSKSHFYIGHEITPVLKDLKNVYFLTPLAKRYFKADILPFADNIISTKIPIYIVQGNITNVRRNYDLLIAILERNYKHDFLIKLLGRGNMPAILNKYKHKLKLLNNLDFENYHKEFAECYCLLPLITIKTHPQYYTNKLTSTMNYAYGYKTKCLIDKDLQDIYKLNNVEIYNNSNDIVNAFERTLEKFYDNC